VEHKLEPCWGCGALVPQIGGSTHRYLGASPGCWNIYGEILEREYGNYRYWPAHRLTVDAYAVQHPGSPSPQTIQSVAVHLISLYLILEEAHSTEEATKTMQRATTHKKRFVCLGPPASVGALTVLYMRGSGSPAEHMERVEEWAGSAWEAWSGHHDTIRRWATAGPSGRRSR